jgi:hypothetical protein
MTRSSERSTTPDGVGEGGCTLHRLTKSDDDPQNYDVVCGHVCALRRYKIRAGGRHAEAMSA